MAKKATNYSTLIPTSTVLMVKVAVVMVHTAMLRRTVPVGRSWGDVGLLTQLEGYGSAVGFRRMMTLIIRASSHVLRVQAVSCPTRLLLHAVLHQVVGTLVCIVYLLSPYFHVLLPIEIKHN